MAFRPPRVAAMMIFGLATLLLPACRTMYYDTMEVFGQHKRDLLVTRVQEARDDQEEAKEQFRDALEAFSAVVDFEGGALEELYERLRSELERSEGKAEDVHERIASIEQVAGDLFKEWEDELDEYSSDALRERSEDQLRTTRRRYEQMINAMQQAAGKMEPVLVALRDQVLFLKHNLNAQAVASLEGDVIALEEDVAVLISEMEHAIAEANAFIEAMSGSDSG